ncbi:PfkB family carbohydrate kinase [Corynebacterium variabile]|uniref:PfkB family carbohydrate kinase n=1 Tax=Corynebacterium variabile TaxID=1727 RepID=UPI0028AE002C|nr:PfkB family carbohydrate kinase [Corynebacterium variabile]
MSGGTVVLVCGTVNIDTFVRVDAFPTAGETVIATPGELSDGGHRALGGKGANQAVAAARFAEATGAEATGADTAATVRLIATVGEDAAGETALGVLRDAGVDASGVSRTTDAPTGQAFIMNDAAGENIIIVTSGANTVTDPASCGDADQADVLLAQGELTPEHSAALPALAERTGARFVLNLAPVTTRDRALIAAADPLIVNETEAADVLGVPRDLGLDEVLDGLAAAVGRGLATSAVVTLGAQGALVIEGDGEDQRTMVASPPASEVVDTTGAGDAFAGTLATALAQGTGLVDAARYAAAAGSLAVRAVGAASSYAPGDTVHNLAENCVDR